MRGEGRAAAPAAAMAVDITLLFKASVKTVKTRNKALGVAAAGDSPRDELLKRGTARSKGDFTSRAREVVSAAPGGGRGAAGAAGSGSSRAGSPVLTAASERPALPGESERASESPAESRGAALSHTGVGWERGVRAGARRCRGRLRARLSPAFPAARPLPGAPAEAAAVSVRIRRPSGPCLRAEHG